MSTPTAPTLLQMPTMFMAGTTVTYSRSLSQYPATDGWALTVTLNGAGLVDKITGTTSGSGYTVTIPAAATAKLAGGVYQWAETVVSSAGTFLAARGAVEIIPNILIATAGELQGFEEKALAIVEAQLLARLQADIQTYTVEQRAAVKIQVDELQRIRGRLIAAMRNKKHPGRFFTPIEVSFGRLGDLNPWPPGRLW